MCIINKFFLSYLSSNAKMQLDRVLKQWSKVQW